MRGHSRRTLGLVGGSGRSGSSRLLLLVLLPGREGEEALPPGLDVGQRAVGEHGRDAELESAKLLLYKLSLTWATIEP